MKRSGVIIGEFKKELGIFDFLFHTQGGRFCVTFSNPYPDIELNKKVAIGIFKLKTQRHGLEVVKFNNFASLAKVQAIKASMSLRDKKQAMEREDAQSQTTIFKDGKWAGRRYICSKSDKKDGTYSAQNPRNFNIIENIERNQ